MSIAAQQDSLLDEDRQDRLVGALCHASAFIFLLGIVLPTIVWLSQKDRSARLRYQALQALVYQSAGIMIAVGLQICNFIFIFGIAIISMLVYYFSPSHNEQLYGSLLLDQAPTALSTLIILVLIFLALIMLACFLVFTIGYPLYLLLSLWAAFRVLRGKDFRYPLVGWLVARWLKITPGREAPA